MEGLVSLVKVLIWAVVWIVIAVVPGLLTIWLLYCLIIRRLNKKQPRRVKMVGFKTIPESVWRALRDIQFIELPMAKIFLSRLKERKDKKKKGRGTTKK